MTVAFQQHNAPPYGAVAITPSSAVLDTGRGVPFRGLYVGGAGDVSVRLLDGSTHTFKNVLAGSVLNFQFDVVNQTNTTATTCAHRRRRLSGASAVFAPPHRPLITSTPERCQ
jgi:hypothetical protein